MNQEVKDALEKLIDVILFGDIDEIPWSYIKDKIPEESHFEISNGDDKEVCIRMAIASTIRWMIKTEQIKSPW